MRRGSAEDRGPRAEGCQLWPLWVLLGFWVLLALVLPWDECSGAPVNLAWDPVADARLTGYELGWGSTSGAYTAFQSAPASETNSTLALVDPGPWYIAVRALAVDGGQPIQSAWSNEIIWQAEPSGPVQPIGQVGLWARYSWLGGPPVMADPSFGALGTIWRASAPRQ